MIPAVADGRQYPEPVVAWLSARRLRFVLVLLFPRLLTIIVIILVTVIDHTSEWLRRRLE